jgi:hypothetical protein
MALAWHDRGVDHAGVQAEDGGVPLLKVAAAAVVEGGRLLVVSKRAAPRAIFSPAGNPNLARA